MTEDWDNGYDPYNSEETRKAPPIPDWLRNDPELVELARAILACDFETIGDEQLPRENINEFTANQQIAIYAQAMRELPKWEPALDTRENWGTPDRYQK